MGYISIQESSFELLFAQVKMAMDKMFTVLSLSRLNHLVGNGGSKVCHLAGPLMPGCNYPIKVWFNKKTFMTHWQIYHIDQHISRIVCKHERYNMKCHYMTDREADMKHHVCNVHTDRLCHLSTQNFTLRKMLGLT